MSECNSCNSNQNFTLRSDTLIKSTDKDLSNFLASKDFELYSRNFSALIIDGEQRLLTYNNTTIQVLRLPTILDSGEKQIIYAFYKLNSTEYFTFVINSKGDFTNILNMSGDWNLWNVDKTKLVFGTFDKSAWVSLAIGTGLSTNNRSIAGCILRMLLDLGPGGALACGLDIELCLLAFGIDCAWKQLIN